MKKIKLLDKEDNVEHYDIESRNRYDEKGKKQGDRRESSVTTTIRKRQVLRSIVRHVLRQENVESNIQY